VSREVHAGFCEQLRGQFPRLTYPFFLSGYVSNSITFCFLIFWIEPYSTNRRPVSCLTAPSLRVPLPCRLIDYLPLIQDFMLKAAMAFGGCHKLDTAVVMRFVIP
jgi:hypothetical protein